MPASAVRPAYTYSTVSSTPARRAHTGAPLTARRGAGRGQSGATGMCGAQGRTRQHFSALRSLLGARRIYILLNDRIHVIQNANMSWACSHALCSCSNTRTSPGHRTSDSGVRGETQGPWTTTSIVNSDTEWCGQGSKDACVVLGAGSRRADAATREGRTSFCMPHGRDCGLARSADDHRTRAYGSASVTTRP